MHVGPKWRRSSIPCALMPLAFLQYAVRHLLPLALQDTPLSCCTLLCMQCTEEAKNGVDLKATNTSSADLELQLQGLSQEPSRKSCVGCQIPHLRTTGTLAMPDTFLVLTALQNVCCIRFSHLRVSFVTSSPWWTRKVDPPLSHIMVRTSSTGRQREDRVSTAQR